MSSTRTASNDAPLAQERWASSPAFARALKANLVALRCSVLRSAPDRELIWHLQALSSVPDALAFAAQNCRTTEEALRELCLNPESESIAPLRPALKQFLAGQTKDAAHDVVVTEIGSMVCEALEYCHEARGMVLIAGCARTGKTFAAQQWVAQHPGRARYVQVPSTADDLAFFMAIARALGITIESNAKTKNLRPRIEAALQSGDLLLVMDDAQFCWPGHNYRMARPSRICWLMTALVNQRVPVALIGTEQFHQAQHEYTKQTGWAAAQFIGRVERFVTLPDRLSMADLERVARAWLPDGEAVAIEALSLYASASAKHLAAIEHAVKRARHLASKSGRPAPKWADVKAAISESIGPNDPGVAGLAPRPGHARRSVSARSARGSRMEREVYAEAET